MNLFRFPRLSALVLAVCSALTLGANVSSAQVSRGEFTLPYETHFGTTVVSPGSYSYTLDRATMGLVLSIRGQGKLIRIPAVGAVSVGQPFEGSALLLVTEGRQTTVRSMQFGHLGLTVRYTKLEDSSDSSGKASHKSS